MIYLLSFLFACTSTEKKSPPPTEDSPSDDTAGDDIAGDDTATQTPPPDGIVISSTHGYIVGFETANLEMFLGIPYATSPIDTLRWQRPLEASPWTEPLQADRAAEECIQMEDLGLEGTPAYTGSEDCLYLNIARPQGTTSAANLPIMFFIHGGSYTAGSGTEETYIDAPKLAERGILVTHNYRLGPFGFLAHPEITEQDKLMYGGAGSSGNQGIFDSLLALQWTYENASAIGGDPEKIMIFGESAGGMTTCALLASPKAEGLFSSAFIQSVGCTWLNQPLSATVGWYEVAEDQGGRIAEKMDCENLSCMRNASIQDVVIAGYTEQNYGPNVDGEIIPYALASAFYYGSFSHVPVAAGFTADEGTLYSRQYNVTTEQELQDTLLSWAEWYRIDDTETLLALYHTDIYGSPQRAFDYFYGDLIFVCPTRFAMSSISYYTPTYGYHYTHIPSWLQYYPELDYLGSYHSSELPFVFGTNLGNLTAQELDFSDQLTEIWANFANGQTTIENLGEWPTYSYLAGGDKWLNLSATDTSFGENVRSQQCDFLAEQWAN